MDPGEKAADIGRELVAVGDEIRDGDVLGLDVLFTLLQLRPCLAE